jgi:Pentapeptide repeats (8 copies)
MFSHCTVEVVRMRWLKRYRWKAAIAIAGMLLLLVLMVWIPVSAAGAYERASGLATPVMGTVQVTPTEDATVTALNKEKLAQEVAQQQHTWENWLWSNAATILSSFLSILVIVVGALIGLWRWQRDRGDEYEKRREDQHTELEKRAEERFQYAVTGLGDKKEGAKIGAAILLRTFLHPGYEQFYIQTFDLAVAHLRLREDGSSIPEDSDSLNQVLITVFKESFPLARKLLEEQSHEFIPESLDATCIQLHKAYLAQADLKQIWMPRAYLPRGRLFATQLPQANLRDSDLQEVDFWRATLTRANLRRTNLSRAYLAEACLQEADLTGANLTDADLTNADLTKGNLTEANPDAAKSLKNAKMKRIIGLTQEQLTTCKAKGAIIDEAPTISPSSHPFHLPYHRKAPTHTPHQLHLFKRVHQLSIHVGAVLLLLLSKARSRKVGPGFA